MNTASVEVLAMFATACVRGAVVPSRAAATASAIALLLIAGAQVLVSMRYEWQLLIFVAPTLLGLTVLFGLVACAGVQVGRRVRAAWRRMRERVE